MATTPQQAIVAGTDGSATAERAVREAARLARSTGARLVVLSAFSDLHPYRERLQSSAREDLIDLGNVSEQVLQRAADAVSGGDLEIETVSRQGDPAEVLADVAEEQGAQLIVLGDRGLTAVKRFLLGSVSNKLAHHAPCNVLIVRGPPDEVPVRRLVPGAVLGGAYRPRVPSDWRSRRQLVPVVTPKLEAERRLPDHRPPHSMRPGRIDMPPEATIGKLQPFAARVVSADVHPQRQPFKEPDPMELHRRASKPLPDRAIWIVDQVAGNGLWSWRTQKQEPLHRAQAHVVQGMGATAPRRVRHHSGLGSCCDDLRGLDTGIGGSSAETCARDSKPRAPKQRTAPAATTLRNVSSPTGRPSLPEDLHPPSPQMA